MERAWTKGPWSVDEVDKGVSAHILGASNGFCADILATLPMQWAESEANATLIAAAPDLFEALDDLVSFIKAHVPLFEDSPLIEDADAALSKAQQTGG